MRAALLLLLLMAAPLHAATVRGRVVVDEGPLPGVTVRLTSSSVARQTTSDPEGRYSFLDVPRGAHELSFHLAAFDTKRQMIDVFDAETVAVETTLSVSAPAEITLSCGMPCGGPPENIWSEPSCDDYNVDSSLIENAQHGDRSAIAMLLERHRGATTHQQRHRIAAALLGRVPNDRPLWNELEAHASTVVRFSEMKEEEREAAFTEWCAQQQIDPHGYRNTSYLAFQYASSDVRALPLLRRALATDDPGLVADAIAALGDRRDEHHYPAIRKALDRLAFLHPSLIDLLSLFQSATADAIAAEYLLDDEARERYEKYRVSTP